MADLPAKQWKDAYAEVDDFTHIIVDNGTSRGKKISKDTAKGIFASQGSQLESLEGGPAGSPTVLNPLGNADYRWAKASPGVYRWNGQNYTATEDKEWIYEWIYPNWVLKPMANRIKGADGKSISDWVAQAYSNGAQVFYGKLLYELAPGQSAAAGDVPGISTKWVQKVGNRLNTDGGALGYEIAMSGEIATVIQTPNVSRFWTQYGEQSVYEYYTSSNIQTLQKGEIIRLRSETENLNNPAIVFFTSTNNILSEETIFYNAINTPELFEYVATETKRFAINYRNGDVAGDFKQIVKTILLKPSDIDNPESPNGIASTKSVGELKSNRGLKALSNLKFPIIGQLRADGSIKTDELSTRFTDPIAVKEDEDITIRTRFGDTVPVGSTIGWFLDSSYNYVSNILTQRRIDPTHPTLIKYESVFTPPSDGVVVFMSSVGASWENPQPWGEVLLQQPIFLSTLNIGENSEVGVVSQLEFNKFKNNGGTDVLEPGIFTNNGIWRPDGEGPHPAVFSMRYTNPIPLAQGQTLYAQVAPEYWNETFNQALAVVYTPEMSSQLAVIRASKEGLNSISYEATENCVIILNHNIASYLFKSRVEKVLPKIYATPGGGGGGGGSGRYIPDVMRYNPIEIIKIELTTTDPIPNAKGSYMRGNLTITIDRIVHTFYGRFEVQGSSSAGYPEKNWTIELFTDSSMTTPVELRIANLLPHSEYVLKVNYIEPMHVCNITANRVYEQMIQTRDGFPKRDTEQRLIGLSGSEAMETGALGHVDGYSAVFFRNGELYGMGTFNIGKKYQNYDLTKDLAAHTQFELGNAVDYTTLGGIELRNPKVKTPEVQAVLDTFTTICSTPLANANTVFRNGFVTSNIVDIYLLLDFFKLVDCISRNNHFMTYNSGRKWLCTPYDLDSWFKSPNGGEISGTTGRVWDEGLNVPANTIEFWKVKVWTVYESEIRARYRQLRSIGVFSADNIYNIARDITIKFDRKLYQQDLAKWPEKSAWSMGLLKLADWVRARCVYMDSQLG